jgi:hypothetical protein
VYTLATPKELEVIVNGHGSCFHEDFDPSPNNCSKPMYTMFNVGGSFMNQIKNNPLTPKVPTNQNDVTHHDPPLQSPLTLKMVNFPTNKGATLETPQFQHVYYMPTTQSIKFHPSRSNINVSCVGTKFVIPYANTSIKCCIGNIDICRKKNCYSRKVGGCNKEELKGLCGFSKPHSSYKFMN